MNYCNFLKKTFLLSISLILVFISLFVSVVHADNNIDYAVVTEVGQPAEEDNGVQKVKLDVKTGKDKNSIFEVSFKPPTQNIKRLLQKGDVVVLTTTQSQDGKSLDVTIQDFYRLPNIFWAPGIFILLLLIIVIVKYKNKAYILLITTVAIALSILIITFIKINSVIVITLIFSLLFFSLLYFIYRKLSIAFVGFLLPLILGIFVYLLSFLSLELGQIQLSYLSIVSNFYGFDSSDYMESFYSATLIGSLIGSMYISYQQILESIRLKVSEITLSKRELTLKSFRHMVKNLDTMIIPSIGIFIGIQFSLFLFLQKSIGVQNTLNSDYWVSFSIIFSICFISWIITVPICALLCGVILGRLEKHKIVTDKTITILD